MPLSDSGSTRTRSPTASGPPRSSSRTRSSSAPPSSRLRSACSGWRARRSAGRRPPVVPVPVLDGGRVGPDLLGQLQDLLGQVKQFLVLRVLGLDGLPLLVCDHLPFRIRPVLADHHERR